MIDLILHQLGIKPDDVKRTMDAFVNGAKAASEVNARLARIEAHLGITGDLVLPPPKENDDGKRNGVTDASTSGGGGRGRGGGRARTNGG